MSAPTAPSLPEASSGLVPRLITGLVIAAFAVTLVLTAPSWVLFAVCLVAFFWAATEFVRLAKNLAPTAPLGDLHLFMPLMALAGFWSFRSGADDGRSMGLLAAAFAVTAAASLSCLLRRSVESRDAAVGMGLLAFGTPYFAVPVVAIYWLHTQDRWLVFLLLAIVAVGDTLAYFGGRAFGRHPLAPRVSPKKTWEGSASGFLGSLLSAAIWCQLRLDEVSIHILVLTAATAVAAQLGDLIESVIKRGAGVKDSSQVLPGHGGLYDRLDAMMLAAPTFAVGYWLLG